MLSSFLRHRPARAVVAAGTVTHTVAAGSATAQLIYVTAQDPNTWTAGLDVPINISLSILGVPTPADAESAQDIKVTRFLVQCEGDGGYDLAADTGEFVVTPRSRRGFARTARHLRPDPSRARGLQPGVEHGRPQRDREHDDGDHRDGADREGERQMPDGCGPVWFPEGVDTASP